MDRQNNMGDNWIRSTSGKVDMLLPEQTPDATAFLIPPSPKTRGDSEEANKYLL